GGREGGPGAERDGAEADRRAQRIDRAQYAEAEGDGERCGDDEGRTEQGDRPLESGCRHSVRFAGARSSAPSSAATRPSAFSAGAALRSRATSFRSFVTSAESERGRTSAGSAFSSLAAAATSFAFLPSGRGFSMPGMGR